MGLIRLRICATMDREGVDVAVLFPTLGLYIIWDDGIEPRISAAICRAYNNWLAEYCSYNPARLKGIRSSQWKSCSGLKTSWDSPAFSGARTGSRDERSVILRALVSQN
jgi:hypothetical protein